MDVMAKSSCLTLSTPTFAQAGTEGLEAHNDRFQRILKPRPIQSLRGQRQSLGLPAQADRLIVADRDICPRHGLAGGDVTIDRHAMG